MWLYALHSIIGKPVSLSFLRAIFVWIKDLFWSPAIDSFEKYPKFLLAIASAKPLSVETVIPSYYVLADAVINLTLSEGKRHEVSFHFDLLNTFLK